MLGEIGGEELRREQKPGEGNELCQAFQTDVPASVRL